jgi:DNA-binding NtrC family response regulator
MNQPPKERTPARRKKKSLVYIVDDEPLLLDLAEATLKPAGYAIKTFQDPELALRRFSRAKPKPNILITDYAMGKMNGLELIEKCKQLHPPLKTMLISGTAGAEIILGASGRVDHFLGKPYQPINFLELVRRLLEA